LARPYLENTQHKTALAEWFNWYSAHLTSVSPSTQKKKKECKTGHAKGKALMGVGGGVKKVKERNMVDILSVQI
jgi:hypothetical protein